MPFQIYKPPLNAEINRWIWKKWFADLRTTINTVPTEIDAALAWTNTSASTTVVPGTSYFITATSLNLTLPASPVDGDWFRVASGDDSMTGVVIVRAGSETIMGLSEDMTLDPALYSIEMVYNAANTDWRVV